MNPVKQLATALQIAPGEGRVVVLLLTYSLLSGLMQTLSYTAAFSLFVSEFGSEQMPWVYLFMTILGIIVTVIHLRAQKQLPLSRILISSTWLALGILLSFRGGLLLPLKQWFIFLLPIFIVMVVHVRNFEFWNVAGRLLDVRQGKRLFGLIGAGEMMARVVGGLLTPTLVTLMGTANLLLVAAGATGGILGVTVVLNRLFAAQMGGQVDERAGQRADAESSTWRNSYTLLIFATAGLGWIALRFIDNMYLHYAALQFPDEAQLAGFFGLVDAASSLLSFIAMVAISSRFIGRWGVSGGLLAYPLTMALFALLFILVDSWSNSIALLFGVTAIMRLLENVLRKAINGPAVQLLYQPFNPAQRSKVQTTSSGLIASLGASIGAILLLILYTRLALSWFQLTLILLVILASWIGAVIRVSRAYPQMLIKALTKRQLDDTALTLDDPATVTMLEQALTRPHAGEVLYALRTLGAVGHPALAKLLPPLLSHPAADVRLAALRAIEASSDVAAMLTALPTVAQLFKTDPECQVRGQALQTLALLDGACAVETLLSHVDDPCRAIRLGALLGLLRNGGADGAAATEKYLSAWIDSAAWEDRALAAQIIGEAEMSSIARYLPALLHDPVVAVRRAAVEAARKVQDPELWPILVEMLDSPELHGQAATSLAAGGDGVLPLLQQAARQHACRPTVLRRIFRVCGKIGSGKRSSGEIKNENAVALLCEWAATPHGAVRTQVLTELSRCGYLANNDSERAWIEQQIQEEVAYSAWLLAIRCQSSLVPSEATTELSIHSPREQCQHQCSKGVDGQLAILLQRALTIELEESKDRLFYWLSFLPGAQPILLVRESLQQPQSEQRAYAREALEFLVPRALYPAISPLVEDLSPQQRLQALETIYPQQERSPTAWLQALVDGETPTTLSPNGWTRRVARAALADREPNQAIQSCTQPYRAGRRESDIMPYRAGRREFMYSIVERVMILNGVPLFAQTPDPVLAEVATILEEVTVPAGEAIFELGELGSSMYVVVTGRVRVHHGTQRLNELGERAAFGEMAALDPAPRSASVTALEETHLFCLNQHALYDLIAERPEVAHGIIRLLSRNLRARTQESHELYERIEN